MAEYYITFHGIAWVEADSEEEAKDAFWNDLEDSAEFTIDEIEERW